MEVEEKRLNRCNCKSCDESLSRGKDESYSRIGVKWKSFEASWCTPRICVVAGDFQKCSGCDHRVGQRGSKNEIW